VDQEKIPSRWASDEQHALLEVVFHASADSIFSVDRGYRLTSFNEAFRRVMRERAGRDFRVGDSVLDSMRTSAERERLKASLDRALAGERFVEELRYDPPPEEGRWAELLRTPIYDRDGAVTGVVVYSKDITHRMQVHERALDANATLERLIAARTEQLAAANRELEAFAYSVSHDLRAPLRAIDGFARIVDRDHGDALPEKARQHFGRIREAAQRMGALIEGLLAFSRLGRQSLNVQPLEVGSVVQAALADLAGEREGRSLELAVGELGRCRADATLLRQVFVNLVGNALKYTRGREPARIEIGSTLQDGRRAWHVADNGVGFDMAHAGRLFGVFQRLHREEDYEGTGVGLALVRRIVERHGGRVQAEARPGAGATFRFTLGDA
jgi:PAS domain S-box-containing protein